MRSPAIGGTRFRLYPSYAEGFAEPEVVELSLPAGTVRAGPSDHSMCVVNPVRKDAPLRSTALCPALSWSGLCPGAAGTGRTFRSYPGGDGTVSRRASLRHRPLDPRHLGTLSAPPRRLAGRRCPPRLELIPLVRWPNAQSGPGFLETGLKPNRMDQPQPFCLNYDVMAHETGHPILFSQIGVPEIDQISVPFLAFHEIVLRSGGTDRRAAFRLGPEPAAGADRWQSLRAEPGEPHRRDFRYRADTTGRQSCHHGRCMWHHARRRRHLDRSDRPGAKPTCRRRAAYRRGIRYVCGVVSGRVWCGGD